MLLAFISIGLNALAQLTLKSLALQTIKSVFDSLRYWQLYATGLLYLASVLTWFLALKKLPLGVSYPLQALGYVIVMILGSLVFSEKVGILQVIGLGVIISGVVLLALGSNR